MKAILAETTGGPLVWGEVPSPQPAPHEVRIRASATAVNRADLMQRKGVYPPPPGASPILGLEVAGVIDAIGTEVHAWSEGDRVCALLSGGGYAEQVVVPQTQVLPVPGTLSLQEAAALPEVFATAVLNLKFEADLQPNESVLLHAGASGVGTAAIQLCKVWGNPVYVTAGSDSKIQRCLELGAAKGLNRHQDTFASHVKLWTQGRGVDVILDPVGGSYLSENQKALAPKGRLILIGLLGGRHASLDLGHLLIKRQQLIGSTLRNRSLAEKSALIRWMREHIWPMFEHKSLHPIICATFSITDAEEAHRLVQSNTTIGKVILTIP